MPVSHPELSLANASQTLQELWLFPVAPEFCNLACTHCLYAASPLRKNPYRLTAEELARIFAELESLGAAPHMLFTGGEPTLHPQLYSLLGQVDQQGYSFQLHTNGTRIHAGEAEHLAGFAHLKKVQISLEGPSPELNDAVMGPGLYQRVLRAIAELRTHEVPVAIAVTPMASNQAHLTAIEQFAEEKGAELVHILLYDLGAATNNGLKPAVTTSRESGSISTTLMCDKGVAYSEGKYFACPVLVKDPDALLGNSLNEALSTQAREQVMRLRDTKAACAVCLKGST
ncbi:MAG TPA: radical SAM protein [Candidatus Binatia bacterium]|jgi:molybdenum cofactor biosynthesis enzyme MoaA|nr:radical SAM protein [Candidatus Binatia bacterium]